MTHSTTQWFAPKQEKRPCKPVPGVLPDDVCVVNESLLNLLMRDAWDFEVKEEKKSYFDERNFNITVKPRMSPNIVEECANVDRKTFIDKDIAECHVDMIDDKWPRCHCNLKPNSGYHDRIPAEKEPGMIYRGMAWEEFEFIKKTGFIESNCSYNIGECQIGLTYFSADPDTAAHYAGGFQPYPFLPTFARPGYVVKIPRPTDDQLDLVSAPPGEIGVRGRIPVDQIKAVFEVRPYEIQPGKYELRSERYYTPNVLTDGGRMGPSMSIVHRQLPVDILTRH